MQLPFLPLFLAAAIVNGRGGYSCNHGPHKIKQKIEQPPREWAKHAPASPDQLLRLKIALPQPHFPSLEKHLSEISDPNHVRYGSFLSKEETEALMAPHPESLDVVSDWLSSYGIEEEHLYRSPAMDWVTILVSVELAEKMLDTKYDIYVHSESGETIVRTTSYSLPENLLEHIELIQPTTMFIRAKPMKIGIHWAHDAPGGTLSQRPGGTITGPAGNQVDASCNNTITPKCLRQIYNLGEYKTSATNGNQLAVTAYLGQYTNNQDLQTFFKQQVPEAYGSNYTFVSVNGGQNNQSVSAAGPEANLDTQFAFGLTYPTPATFYSTGGSPPYIPDVNTPTDSNEPYADWLDYVLSQDHLPQTISTSYGDDEQTVPEDYAQRVCNGFAIIGARGVSLLFGSGDFGVGGDCLTNDGTNKTMFLPSFPASCPYVTTVGGTYQVPEVSANFSGGGFSNYFSRPSYQENAVSNYLQTLPTGTYEGLYNPDGRGVPDVAAQAVNFNIVHQGEWKYVDGTSCSAPTFASFISMLNDARITAGKPPLGFLNPWLYSVGPMALNDITTGNNPGCGTDGFNATAGWDPVTGLGTPNFQKLLELALVA